MKKSKRFLSALLLLCLPLALCYSITDDEIMAALTEIATEIETASTAQSEISAKLDEIQNEQKATAERQENISNEQANISQKLEKLENEQLQDTNEQVNSLKDSFENFRKSAARDNAMMLGAMVVTFIVAVISLAVAL